MQYLPHAVASSKQSVNGSVREAFLADNSTSEKRGGKYAVFLEVEIFGVPGSRTLKHVRYFKSIELKAGAETRISPAGYYDEVIQWALSKGETLEKVNGQIRSQFQGKAISCLNLGGRWIVQ